MVELIRDRLNLTSTDDPIDKPQHIKTWTLKKKLDWLLRLLQPVTEELFKEFDKPSLDNITMHVDFGGSVQNVTFPAAMRGQTVTIRVNNILYQVAVPTLPRKVHHRNDELVNSSLGFLRLMMDFLVFNDIIHAGDITRLPAILKRLCPTFIGLTSYMSKYAIECVNLITKLEWVLSEREKVKVMMRAFVNPAGKPGRNKPADMQQENNIKAVKSVLRGLGASKTNAAIVRSSKAAPAIDNMALTYQEACGIKARGGLFEHHKKDSSEDASLVKEELQEARPFATQEGRTVDLKVSSWPTDSVEKNKFMDFVKRNAARAVNHCDIQFN